MQREKQPGNQERFKETYKSLLKLKSKFRAYVVGEGGV